MKQLDIRFTTPDGLIVGLTYLADGFAETVPCTFDGCRKPANLMLYELQNRGFVLRRCHEHMTGAQANFVGRLPADLHSLFP